MRETLEERAERLALAHRLPGERRREVLAGRPCGVPSCTRAGALYPCGVRCPEHGHVQPVPTPTAPPVIRAPREYGPVDPSDPTARPWCDTCQRAGVAHHHRKGKA